MNCLSQLSSYTATIVGRTARFIAANRSSSSSSSSILSFPRKSAFSGVSSCHSELFLNRFHFRCYSARKGRKTASSRLPKVEPEAVMEQEKDAFYVVRKGDIVGVYNSLSDSQAQVGSSVILLGTSLSIIFLVFFFSFLFVYLAHKMLEF